jgi:hypothetical protein
MNAEQGAKQDASTRTSERPLSQKASIVGALLLVGVDGIAVGQGGLAVFLATWVLLVRIPLLALAWNDKPLRAYRAKKIAIYLLAASAVLGWVAYNHALGYRRAESVVAAVHAYAAERGRYPASLRDLVPAFLPAVPKAKLTLLFNQFEYRRMPGGAHWLTWTVVPPFGRRSYLFEEKRWNYLD